MERSLKLKLFGPRFPDREKVGYDGASDRNPQCPSSIDGGCMAANGDDRSMMTVEYPKALRLSRDVVSRLSMSSCQRLLPVELHGPLALGLTQDRSIAKVRGSTSPSSTGIAIRWRISWTYSSDWQP